MVFGIHCKIFIALPNRLKTCRSSCFSFFTKQIARPRKIGLVSKAFCAQALPIGIGCAICPAFQPFDMHTYVCVSGLEMLAFRKFCVGA